MHPVGLYQSVAAYTCEQECFVVPCKTKPQPTLRAGLELGVISTSQEQKCAARIGGIEEIVPPVIMNPAIKCLLDDINREH
jgi:hypothetical protein